MNTIRIDYGVSTTIEVDLSGFDFTGIAEVIMTARNTPVPPDNDVIFERSFTTAEVHTVNITPEESRRIYNDAVYDFDIITNDGNRHKNGDNGKIILRRGVGQCPAVT